MLRRRKSEETDWQSELTARSAPVGSRLEVVEASRDNAGRPAQKGVVARRIRTVLWSLVKPLNLAIPLGILIVGHRPVRWALFGLWVCAMALDTVAASRRKRAEQKELEPTPEDRVRWELRIAADDLRWFLGNPPARGRYDFWLSSTRSQLERLSPDVAARWTQPDRGPGPAGETVSAGELESRRRRLLDLYTEVATPEALAFLESTLPQAPSARAMTSS